MALSTPFTLADWIGCCHPRADGEQGGIGHGSDGQCAVDELWLFVSQEFDDAKGDEERKAFDQEEVSVAHLNEWPKEGICFGGVSRPDGIEGDGGIQ